jgi:uncharacterized membrane protein
MSDGPARNETDVQSRRSRRLLVALVASLAVNAVVLGGLATAAWHHRHGSPAMRGGGHDGLMGFTRQLDAERREPVRAQFQAAREVLKPLREDIATAWLQANAALAAEPYDAQNLKSAMARLADAESRFKTALAESLADMASKLTAEERRLLAEWRERRFKSGKGRRWRHREHGESETNP